MSRPNAAYVGMGLSHPIRLVMNRGLHGNVAKLLSVREASELIADLTEAVAAALQNDKPRVTRARSTDDQPTIAFE